MCERGDTVTMVLPARPLSDPFGKHLSYSIDRCIAPLVAALNRGGITTVACCCGHGKAVGSIVLGHGRALIIAENQAEFDRLTVPPFGDANAENLAPQDDSGAGMSAPSTRTPLLGAVAALDDFVEFPRSL